MCRIQRLQNPTSDHPFDWSAPDGSDEPNELKNTQLSIVEIFFLTTFVASLMAVYLYLSQLIACLAGGFLVVLGCIRWFRSTNIIVGGVFGFGVTAAMIALVALLVRTDLVMLVPLLLILPPVGYFCGAFMAEYEST